MKSQITKFATLSLLFGALAGPTLAGKVERACYQASDNGAKRRTCSCIQAIAQQRLTSSEQALIARWLQDPQKADTARRSSSAKDVAFWERYEAFGAHVQKSCG